jgi:hypothetical protein
MYSINIQIISKACKNVPVNDVKAYGQVMMYLEAFLRSTLKVLEVSFTPWPS